MIYINARVSVDGSQPAPRSHRSSRRTLNGAFRELCELVCVENRGKDVVDVSMVDAREEKRGNVIWTLGGTA